MKCNFYALVVLMCLSCYNTLYAQSGSGRPSSGARDKKWESLSKDCDKLIDESRYGEVIMVARQGIALCSENDKRRLAQFNYLVGYGFEYWNNSYDSAVYYYEKALPYAQRAKSLYDEVNVLMRLNYMYYSVGKFARRDTLIQYIKTIVDTTRDIHAQAILNGSIGEYYLDLSAYENFIRYKLKAIDYRKKLRATDSTGNKENIGISYLQIVQAYLKMHQDGKALEYLGYSREYVNHFRDGEAFMCNDYVNAYLNLDKMDSAALYDQRLYRMMHREDSLFINLSFSRRLFADYYVRKGKIPVAEQHAYEALRLAQKSGDEEILVEAHIALGNIEYLKGRYGEAINYLSKALPGAYNFDREMYVAIQKKMAQSYAALHQWEKAYTHYEIYSHLQDTLYAESSKQSLANAEAQYQNKEKQLQINGQKTQLAYAGKQRLWLIAGLLLVSMVAVLLIVIYRNKKRIADVLDEKNKKLAELNNNLEQANQTKAKLFGIISHDLRSPISQVYQFLKLQQLDPDCLNDEQKAALSHKIQTATGSLLETMEDLLLWSKTQMNQFKTDMQPVFVHETVTECLKLLQLNIEAKKLVVDNHVSEGARVVSDPYFLQTILRNLLQNAIKASPQHGAVKIGFADQQFFVENQGGHFSQQQYETALASKESEKSLSGLGLQLVDELSKKINTQVLFETANADTTHVRLTFGTGV